MLKLGSTLTSNIRKRRGAKVAINMPIFYDINTPRPFLEPLPPSIATEHGPDICLPDVEPAAKPNHIYMDCMAFGMGCCCLQVTFQACSVEEARRLYDQLAVMAPIMASFLFAKNLICSCVFLRQRQSFADIWLMLIVAGM